MICKVWRTNEKVERTSRYKKPDMNREETSEEIQNKITEKKELESQQYYTKPNNTLREDSCIRRAERELLAQSAQNPFVQSDYIRDITIQEQFLKPNNSNFTKHE